LFLITPEPDLQPSWDRTCECLQKRVLTGKSRRSQQRLARGFPPISGPLAVGCSAPKGPAPQSRHHCTVHTPVQGLCAVSGRSRRTRKDEPLSSRRGRRSWPTITAGIVNWKTRCRYAPHQPGHDDPRRNTGQRPYLSILEARAVGFFSRFTRLSQDVYAFDLQQRNQAQPDFCRHQRIAKRGMASLLGDVEVLGNGIQSVRLLVRVHNCRQQQSVQHRLMESHPGTGFLKLQKPHCVPPERCAEQTHKTTSGLSVKHSLGQSRQQALIERADRQYDLKQIEVIKLGSTVSG
jgi:hypothetical protein